MCIVYNIHDVMWLDNHVACASSHVHPWSTVQMVHSLQGHIVNRVDSPLVDGTIQFVADMHHNLWTASDSLTQEVFFKICDYDLISLKLAFKSS